MRKIHPREFKFKVALEALKGDLTIAQIVSKYQVAESLVHKWRKQLVENGAELFGKGPPKTPDPVEDVEKLHATIGRLKVENDFLGRALSKFKNGSADQ